MIIGLDVGGTHTDAVLLDQGRVIEEVKVTTDHADLFDTVLQGINGVTRRIDSSDIHRIVLSTTLTTNAVIQNQLPAVGMMVSAGPGLDAHLFKTGDPYFVVDGALDHRGREIEPIRPDQIRSTAAEMQRQGVRQVGIVGKFSIRNPQHELQIREMLEDRFDSVFMGHRISGLLNFPRRIYTTYLNAAVYPIHRHFYEAVQQSLNQKGLTPPLRILKADGGNMNLNASMGYPAQTILSGPSASIMGSVASAPADETCLVLDIGGTTTDMGILIDRVPILEPLGIRLGRYPTLIRALNTHSIGLGGDSCVKVVDGKPVIGPERLGPAMAFGGPAPTPTDALHILDRIDEGDREKSREGIQPIADTLNCRLEAAAEKIFDHFCHTVLSEARSFVERINRKPVYTVHELQEGRQAQPTRILVLGGAAPLFAPRLEELSEFGVTVIPRWKVANAVGAALARTTSEVDLSVDTEKGVLTAAEEGIHQSVERTFGRQAAIEFALELLRQKAVKRGANPQFLETEVVEALEFNMVRGFRTTGKNIRVRVQVKPGLIEEAMPQREKS